MKEKQVKWFAYGGGISKAGPFDSQVLAYKAMTLIPKCREVQDFPFPKDICVWPEEV